MKATVAEVHRLLWSLPPTPSWCSRKIHTAEGVAAGNAAKALIRGMVNQPTATSVLPPGYYNPNPPETSFYGQPSLSGATAARIAYCNSPAAVNDITCQAIRTAIGLGKHAATARQS